MDTDKDRAASSKPASSELYVQFYYPEIKDLSKSFLTLVSGLLAFSVTFSRDIIGFPPASPTQLHLLITSWLFLIVAIIADGAGIYASFSLANIANKALTTNTTIQIRKLVRLPYLLLTIAGVAFVLGLIFLTLAGISKYVLNTP